MARKKRVLGDTTRRRYKELPPKRDWVLVKTLADACTMFGLNRTETAAALGVASDANLRRGDCLINEEVALAAQALLRTTAEKWVDGMLSLTTVRGIDADDDRAAAAARATVFDLIGGLAHHWIADVRAQMRLAIEQGLVSEEARDAVMAWATTAGDAATSQPAAASKKRASRAAEVRPAK